MAEKSGTPAPDRPVDMGRRPIGPHPSPQVGIVLATLNERENLAILLSEIAAYLPERPEIVIVDDGSVDGTREFIRAVASRHPEVHGVFNDVPQTIARAHEQGLGVAQAPYLICMDSDLQHPPSAIPRMVEQLKAGYDVVVGSRYLPGGGTGARTPIRGLISRCAGLLARFALRSIRGVSDPNSGFFGVRRSAMVLCKDPPRGYYTLMFLLARMRNPRVTEVPYVFRERGNGESKVLSGLAFPFVYAMQLLTARRLEVRSRAAYRKHSASQISRLTESESIFRA